MCDIKKTGEWKTFECEDDISTRVYSRAVVVNDKIWIIGGRLSTGKTAKDVEIIDTKTMAWTTAPSLIIPHKYHTMSLVSEKEKKWGEIEVKQNGNDSTCNSR